MTTREQRREILRVIHGWHPDITVDEIFLILETLRRKVSKQQIREDLKAMGYKFIGGWREQPPEN